jgi:transcriptional regulator with GAF, ATPase, and Fis domain
MPRTTKKEHGDPALTGRETRELRSLLDISRSLHQSINLDHLLLQIVSKIRQAMHTESVSVILHDEAANQFFFRMVESDQAESAEKVREVRFPVDQGIAGSVFRSGVAELIPDAAKDPRHYCVVDQKTDFTTRSMIAVPLQTKGKTIGVLEVLNKKTGQFDEQDVRFLKTIAGPVAMALENARIHAELAKAYEELQRLDEAKDHLLEQTEKENLLLRQAVEVGYRFDQIKGNSPKMLELFRLCEKVFNSDISVLIEGETGTGKELIARCIHCNGLRRNKPFVTQNCGGIPDTLLASELFGHKRGAFTGAVADKKGLFETAHGGTIFLDEVAEMSPAMQVSLLRVLQEGEIRPLGSDHVRKVDVRVVSATNRNLAEDVKTGRFREDLFYRLNVFALRVPPLRERSGDVPLLALHFMGKFNKKSHKSVLGFSHEALQCLLSYPFPGNVRELENEIERAVAMAEDHSHIEIENLSERIRCKPAWTEGAIPTDGKLKTMVETLEKSVLVKMLEEHRGNKTRIAQKLGLSRLGLHKKLARYGLR